MLENTFQKDIDKEKVHKLLTIDGDFYKKLSKDTKTEGDRQVYRCQLKGMDKNKKEISVFIVTKSKILTALFIPIFPFWM